MQDFFRDETAEKLMARVEQAWDLTGPYPIPKWNVACPCCRKDRTDEAIHIRAFKFFIRHGEQHAHWYRCDVHFKCRYCSLTWFAGVPVPQEMYENNPHREKTTRTWRKAVEDMKEMGLDPEEVVPGIHKKAELE